MVGNTPRPLGGSTSILKVVVGQTLGCGPNHVYIQVKLHIVLHTRGVHLESYMAKVDHILQFVTTLFLTTCLRHTLESRDQRDTLIKTNVHLVYHLFMWFITLGLKYK